MARHVFRQRHPTGAARPHGATHRRNTWVQGGKTQSMLHVSPRSRWLASQRRRCCGLAQLGPVPTARVRCAGARPSPQRARARSTRYTGAHSKARSGGVKRWRVERHLSVRIDLWSDDRRGALMHAGQAYEQKLQRIAAAQDSCCARTRGESETRWRGWCASLRSILACKRQRPPTSTLASQPVAWGALTYR